MTKLEDFERTASDPNRFFAKGKLIMNLQNTLQLGILTCHVLIELILDNTGSSAARIRESKTRDWFNKVIPNVFYSNIRF